MVYRVIHILILEHRFFFYYKFTINMVNNNLPDREVDLRGWWEEKDIMSKLSDQELIMLVRLGMKWQQQQGPGSWCDLSVLLSAATIPDEDWTVNRLKTYAKCGTNAIIYSLLPNMIPIGVIERVSQDRYERYRVTDAGRNVLLAMYTYCDTCDNDRKCIWCSEDRFMTNEPGTTEPAEPCSHVFMKVCKNCDGTGKTVCIECNGAKKTVNTVNNLELQCWCCNIGGINGESNGTKTCDTCWGKNECNKCENHTRRIYCRHCDTNRNCRNCQEIKSKCLG